jgi:hypothetical protein
VPSIAFIIRCLTCLPNVLLCGGPFGHLVAALRWRPVRTNKLLEASSSLGAE